MNPVLNSNCAENNSNKTKCLFPEHLIPYIQTPLFVTQTRFDTWQIINILGVEPNATYTSQINGFGNILSERATHSILSSDSKLKNALFLESCAHHTNGYASTYIGDINIANAFYLWYSPFLFANQLPLIIMVVVDRYTNLTATRFWFQEAPFECKSCCSNYPNASSFTPNL